MKSTLFFIAVTFFGRFFRRLDLILAPYGLHFGASGLHLGSILEIVGPMLVPSWRYLGAFGRKSLHWMGWWGYAKRQEFWSIFGSMFFFATFRKILSFRYRKIYFGCLKRPQMTLGSNTKSKKKIKVFIIFFIKVIISSKTSILTLL